MSKLLKINASKVIDAAGKESYERTLDVPTPKCLLTETIEDMVTILGSDYVLHQLKAQMKISYRAKVRTAMEKRDDNGEFENTDDFIISKVADINWTPELRIAKSAEEKLDETLAKMDPKILEAYLAQKIKALKGEKKAAKE